MIPSPTKNDISFSRALFGAYLSWHQGFWNDPTRDKIIYRLRMMYTKKKKNWFGFLSTTTIN